MRKAIPFFICMFLLLSVSAAAEKIERETYFNGEYTYALREDGTAEILLYGFDETEPENLVIPSVLDGHPVTRIADRAFWPCRHLVSVTIPESVTYNGTTYSVSSINYKAFNGCSGLTSVTIPNSVTSIDSYAFSGCI